MSSTEILNRELLDSLNPPMAERGWVRQRRGEWTRALSDGITADLRASTTASHGRRSIDPYLSVSIPWFQDELDGVLGDLWAPTVTLRASARLRHPTNRHMSFTDEDSAAEAGRCLLEVVDSEVERILAFAQEGYEEWRVELDAKHSLFDVAPVQAYLGGFVYGEPVVFAKYLARLRRDTFHPQWPAIAERLEAVAVERGIPIVEPAPEAAGGMPPQAGQVASGDGKLVTSVAAIQQDLWVFGEDELVERLGRDGLSAEQLSAVGAGYSRWMRADDPASTVGAAMPFDKAMAYALVEELEGASRPLARKRRRPRDEAARRFPAVGPTSITLW